MKRSDLALLGAAVVCGGVFLASLDKLWPVTDLDLQIPAQKLLSVALEHQAVTGLKLTDWTWATQVSLDESALSWLERGHDRVELRRLLQEGLPVYQHEIQFKQRGQPEVATFWVHPEVGLVGWRRTMEDDVRGVRIDSLSAWNLGRMAVREHLGMELTGWELRRHDERKLLDRTDHAFVFERTVEPGSKVRERLSVEVAGNLVREARLIVVVPPAYLRGEREKHVPESFLQTVAFTVFASMGVAAFLYMLWGLRKGLVGLKTPMIGSAVVLVCLAASRLWREYRIFELWDPLGPRAMAAAKVLMTGLVGDLLPAILVFSFLAASEALDSQTLRPRGNALRRFLELRWSHADVGQASLRGFLLGWVAGGVLAGATWLLSHLTGSLVEMQPRGFFFHSINSLHPTLLMGVFFLQIALVEELGYRYFAGNGLLKMGFKPLVVALVPALIYGAVHSGLNFLPPAEPWWARLIPITLVGCLWGLAFVRWDALTVVLSHWACDLFLFNRVRLASSDPYTRLGAIACISLPLVPAVVVLSIRLWKQASTKSVLKSRVRP